MTKTTKPAPKETKPKADKSKGNASEESSTQETHVKKLAVEESAVEEPAVEETSSEDAKATQDTIKELAKAAKDLGKKKNPFHAKAKEVFASHNANEVHFTNDGTGFLHIQHARMHADNIKDPKIHTIKREEV